MSTQSDPRSGTFTLLIADLEDSVPLWEAQPDAMRAAVTRYRELATAEIERHGGEVVRERSGEDSLLAVFSRASDAVDAACRLQRAYLAEAWPAEAPLRVRMALHTGELTASEGSYDGAAIHRAMRLCGAAHGGQVVLSRAVRNLVQDHLSSECNLQDLGSHLLPGLARPDQVYQLRHPELPPDFPPLRSVTTATTNLPQQVTSFVGRGEELEKAARKLQATQLLTLTGVGGAGKTRFALRLAADLQRDYPDGVWLVELAALETPEHVADRVAQVLGLREAAHKTLVEGIAEHLQSRRVLLLLDNCEHLIDACAQLAETLIIHCPRLTLLTTSRVPLNVPGETVYRLPTLSVPDPAENLPAQTLREYGAVRLFEERAASASPSFWLTDQNSAAVVEICRRLDGIPLAIELAAARIKVLPPEQLLQRLDQPLRILTGGSRAAPARQQTLRALLEWSCDLLTPPEQALLRRLAVFSGGWTLEAAEAVCSLPPVEEEDVLDLLTALVDKSLVAYEEGPSPRYRLLETVREFGRELLAESGEEPAVRDRHCSYFHRLLLQARQEPSRERERHREWLRRLGTEHENLRAALQWSLEAEDPLPALRMAAGLGWFWGRSGRLTEGRERLAAVLARSTPTEPAEAAEAARLRAAVLIEAGTLAMPLGDLSAAAELFRQSLALAEQVEEWPLAARALQRLAETADEQGREQTALPLYERSLALFRRIGDRHGIASLLMDMGNLFKDQGAFAGAEAAYQEGLTLFQEIQDSSGVAWAHEVLGLVAHQDGRPQDARPLLERSLEMFEELGSPWKIAEVRVFLGVVAVELGDNTAARTLLADGVRAFRDANHQWGLAYALQGMACLLTAQGQVERAARLFGYVQNLRERIATPLPPSECPALDRWLSRARAALGEPAFTTAYHAGAAMSQPEVITTALDNESPNP